MYQISIFHKNSFLQKLDEKIVFFLFCQFNPSLFTLIASSPAETVGENA